MTKMRWGWLLLAMASAGCTTSTRVVMCEDTDCRGARPRGLECGPSELIAVCENVGGSCEWVAPTACPPSDDGDPCLRDLDCSSSDAYCRGITGQCPGFDPQGMSTWGECVERSGVCPGNVAPVCGCDGQTYSNACMAGQAGMSVRATGACPTPITPGGACVVGGQNGRCFSGCPDHLVDGERTARSACGSPELTCCVARRTG